MKSAFAYTGYIMRIPRIYHPEAISTLGNIPLSEDAAGHIGRVLRMTEGQEVLLFDGSWQLSFQRLFQLSRKRT